MSQYIYSMGIRSLTIIASCVVLTNCSSVKSAIGLEKTGPDEFAVVTRAPLSLPPNYELVPPRPGARRPQEVSSQDKARAALVDQRELKTLTEQSKPYEPKGISSAEQGLLQQAGATTVPSNIRQVVDAEAPKKRTIVDTVLQTPEQPNPQVDPIAERERLKKLPSTTSDNAVPMTDTKPESLWDRLF